jgi:hypothetical protein
MKGVEPLSTGLQDRRSVIHLSYIAMNESGVYSPESRVVAHRFVCVFVRANFSLRTTDSRLRVWWS